MSRSGFCLISLVSPHREPPGIDNQDSAQPEEQCGEYWDDFTDSAYIWRRSNTALATLPTPTLYTVTSGSATVAAGSDSPTRQGILGSGTRISGMRHTLRVGCIQAEIALEQSGQILWVTFASECALT